MDPFKNPTLNNSKPKKKASSSKPSSFIEALKDFKSGVKQQAKDATLGVANSAFNQLTGAPRIPLQPESGDVAAENKQFNFAEFLKSREQLIKKQERFTYERRYREEKLVFSRKQEEVKLQIKAIQEELSKLANSTQGLSIEIKKAAFQAVVNPGAYHVSFFEKLRRTIQFVRKKLADSKTWLQTMNNRSKKKSHYWHHVKKSGTKFMLSQERYMSTQVG